MSNKKKHTPYQPPVKETPKAKLEKKHIIAICVSAAVIAITALLIYGFTFARDTYTFKNGEIVSTFGTVYKPVQVNYRPLQYETDKVYAKLDHPIFGKIPLYEVAGTHGAWLYCPEDEVLYRKSNVSVPDFAKLKPTSIVISTTGTRELSIKVMEDTDTVEKYAAFLADEKNIMSDPGRNPDDTYRLSFRFEEYPFLQYTVSYFQYGDSFFAIYDRNTASYYPCGDEFYKLLKGADLETGDTAESEK